MKKFSIIIICTTIAINIYAQNISNYEGNKSVKLQQQDSISTLVPQKNKLKFTQIDTNYIEPKHFNFTVQLCANTSFDYFYGEMKNDITLLSSASLAPIPTIKVGPYIGWRWLTYCYTFAINHSTFSSDKWKQKSEF